ncbi:cilia- and flagella-associated protein 45 [Scaptodrosophila lebanonensis]|uniref:Cilia- and flagella-associated protein 45 n=1 Tax=Drosophila lebanonensis TaxID=7225 RepID=A0A6J2T772_DROLE|nr:cilia- and flagella-associated protein 45 [Scaptodrosophila lebanonensis]
MPCYSASNVRFVSAESQMKQIAQELRERAKTAAYHPPVSFQRPSITPNLKYVPFRRRCDQFAAYDQKQLRRNERDRKRNQGHKEVVLRPNDLNRLKNQSKVVTKAEQLQINAKIMDEHEKNLEMVEEARLHFKKIDDARKAQANAKLENKPTSSEAGELEQEKMSVLHRAFLAKQEQEEEVKQINRMILNAKCKAVREAQIQEKYLLARALREDDERMARMVNERAREALNADDQRERREVERRAQYAQDIRQQLSERENLRLLEAKRVADEAKDLRKAADLVRADEQRQRDFVQLRKRRFREELNRVSEMSKLLKQLLCEQERMAELRISAYMRQKQEKEKQLQEMKQQMKQQFERRQQLIYEAAVQARETRQTSDELKFLRERDRLERDYLRREKEAALQKREQERDLLAARTQQAQEIKQRLALEIAHAEEEFNKVMERMREEEEKQKCLDRERDCRRQVYKRDLKQQMTEKDAERLRQAEMERTRMQKWLDKEQQREANIKQVISSKIAAMRENCLPEKYLKEVEKRLKKIQESRNRIF